MDSLMNEERFWHIIDISKEESDGNLKKQLKLMEDKLFKLSEDEILDFHGLIEEKKGILYDIEKILWSIANKINGPTSDDGFEYFLCWIVSQGKKIFSDVLKNPEIIFEITAGEIYGECNFELEELNYVTQNAFERKTGKDWWAAWYEGDY